MTRSSKTAGTAGAATLAARRGRFGKVSSYTQEGAPEAAPAPMGHNQPPSDLLWGARAIGEAVGRSETQIYTMIAEGLLDGAVRKLSHKRIVGSRRELHRVLMHADAE